MLIKECSKTRCFSLSLLNWTSWKTTTTITPTKPEWMQSILHIIFLFCFVAGAPPPWNGLRMAVEPSPVCPQNLPSLNNSHQHLTTGRYNQLKRLMRYLQNESEDCLFLNLYVPEWCKYSFGHSNRVDMSRFLSHRSFCGTVWVFKWTEPKTINELNFRFLISLPPSPKWLVNDNKWRLCVAGIGPRPIYPVLVFVHGESFEWNSGNAYDGSVLSSYGQVIVVTINYRLGILGKYCCSFIYSLVMCLWSVQLWIFTLTASTAQSKFCDFCVCVRCCIWNVVKGHCTIWQTTHSKMHRIDEKMGERERGGRGGRERKQF